MHVRWAMMVVGRQPRSVWLLPSVAVARAELLTLKHQVLAPIALMALGFFPDGTIYTVR